MAVLFLQYVARGAVGTPGLASVGEVGVPSSICHLPPARGARGASHATCLEILPSVIQTGGGYLGSAVCQDGWGAAERGGKQVMRGTGVFLRLLVQSG